MNYRYCFKKYSLFLIFFCFFAMCVYKLDVTAADTDYSAMYQFSGGKIQGFQQSYLDSLPEENGIKYVDIVIPDSIGGTPVTGIGDSAFLGNKSQYANVKVRRIDLSGALHLTSIEKWAFYAMGSMYSEMEPSSLTLSPVLQTIGSNAFSGQSKLTGSLAIPDSVTTIDYSAFMNCGFDGTLKLPENPAYTQINYQLFENCSFTGILTIPEAVTSISAGGSYAFAGNLFTEVVLNNKITSIGGSSFKDCRQLERVRVEGKDSQDSLVLPDPLKEMGSMVFQNCSKIKGTVRLPDTLATVGSQIFEGTGLKTIYMPNTDSVTYKSNFLFNTDVNAAVFPSKELYDRYQSLFSSGSRKYFSYPLTLTFLGLNGEILGTREVLYNRPIHFQETGNGWEIQADFTFPDTEESKVGYDTGFSFSKGGKALNPQDIVKGSTLYYTQSLSAPTVTFQEVGTKTYDGQTEYIRCEASHPLAGEDGQYTFLYLALKGNSDSFFYVSDEPFEYPVTDVADSMQYVCYVQMYDRSHPEYRGDWNNSAWYDYFATNVNIRKADPLVNPLTASKVLAGTAARDVPLGLSPGDTPGTLSITDTDSVIDTGENVLNWSYTPADDANYTSGLTGQVTVNGVEKLDTKDVEDTITKLPDTVENKQDERDILNAWKGFTTLTPAEKEGLSSTIKTGLLHKLAQVPGIEVENKTTGYTAELPPGQEEKLLSCLTNEDVSKLLDGSIEKYVISITSKEIKQLPEEISVSLRNVLGSYKNGINYDIDLEKQLYARQTDSIPSLTEPVHELSVPVSINFTIPDQLKAPQGQTKHYAVFRTHEQNGAFSTTQLKSTAADNTITVETSLFSAYTLAYKEKAAGGQDSKPAPDNTSVKKIECSEKTVTGKKVTTGDGSMASIYWLLVLLSSVVIASSVSHGRRGRSR